MKVELIYDRDCPNYEQTRENLIKALARTRREARWTEWDRADIASPSYVHEYGSPSVLVNGADVAGASADHHRRCDTCRLYSASEGGLARAPSVAQIARALRSAPGTSARRWRSSAGSLPGIMASVLPHLSCPACWPAYAGLLGSFGLGFLAEDKYLLPLTVIFLLIAICALGHRARARRGYAPFALGVFAAAAIYLGKFGIESNPLMYAGIAGLVIASAWNAWPKARCPSRKRGGGQRIFSTSSKEA